LDGYRFLRHNSLAIVKNVNAPSIETSQWIHSGLENDSTWTIRNIWQRKNIIWLRKSCMWGQTSRNLDISIDAHGGDDEDIPLPERWGAPNALDSEFLWNNGLVIIRLNICQISVQDQMKWLDRLNTATNYNTGWFWHITVVLEDWNISTQQYNNIA
jgi:hypothetical protein